MNEKLIQIEVFIRNFISDDIIVTKRENQITLQKGDLFLDFTIDEDDIESPVISSGEIGIGHPYEIIF